MLSSKLWNLAGFSLGLLVVAMVLLAGGRESAPGRTLGAAADPWESAGGVRPGAGGLEAERGTWLLSRKRFDRTAKRSGEQWSVPAGGDARPIMRRMRIEALGGGAVRTPFLLSDKNYDFRSVPDLVRSLVRGKSTDEQKALAIRELLIGEGFYFHFNPPQTPDPIHRLTNAGYGYCGTHAQIYELLAQAAGLRTTMCSHPFGYGHATNQVFYEGQWHFIDSDMETVVRRSDGVIPSYEEFRSNPSLVPPGDAYGQASSGLGGVRYVRALYSADTKCSERKLSQDTTFATLDYSLQGGESITWDWADANFQYNRANKFPVYGKGTIEHHLKLSRFVNAERAFVERGDKLTLGEGISDGVLRTSVHIPYPALEVSLSATVEGAETQYSARISGDQGTTWIPIELLEHGPRTTWRTSTATQNLWADQPDTSHLTPSERTSRAGRYGYTLEIRVRKTGPTAPSLAKLRLITVFQHYPPALPFLKAGPNHLTYVGATDAPVRVTLEWDERKRQSGLSSQASAWGWNPPVVLSRDNAALPTITSLRNGAVSAVYSVGEPGSRRIAVRTWRDGSWTGEQRVSREDQDATHPVLSEDANGNLWIAYQTGGLWKGGDVWVLSIKDSKASAPVRMNTTDPFHVAFFPSISTHGARVAVSWEGGQIDKGIRTAWGTEVGWVRHFDGESWSAPQMIKGKPFTNLGLPKVMYDPLGRLHLTGTKGPRYYLPLSETHERFQWLTPEWMYHSRGAELRPDKDGNVWAVFDGQNSGTTNEIYLRMLPSRAVSTETRNWKPAIRISEDDKKPSVYPDVVAASRSRLAVVWMDYRNKNAEIYAKMFDHGRWSPDVLISAPADAQARRESPAMTPNEIAWSPARGLQSEYPHAIASRDGTIWCVWQESVDGNSVRVLARKLTRSGGRLAKPKPGIDSAQVKP